MADSNNTSRRFLVNLSPDLIALEANAQAKTQFMNCDMSESAEEFVAAACEKWHIESSDFHKYCLIFDDTKKYLTEGRLVHKNVSLYIYSINSH